MAKRKMYHLTGRMDKTYHLQGVGGRTVTERVNDKLRFDEAFTTLHVWVEIKIK